MATGTEPYPGDGYANLSGRFQRSSLFVTNDLETVFRILRCLLEQEDNCEILTGIGFFSPQKKQCGETFRTLGYPYLFSGFTLCEFGHYFVRVRALLCANSGLML